MNKSKKWLAISAGSLVLAAVSAIFSPRGSENKRRVMCTSKKLERTVSNSVGDDKKELEDVKKVLEKQLDKVNKRIEELS